MQTSDEVIAAIESELGTRPLDFRDPFEPFRKLDIGQFPDSDQQIVRLVVTNEILKARNERPGPDALYRGLERSRALLLSPASGLTVSARDFIKDHCPCG